MTRNATQNAPISTTGSLTKVLYIAAILLCFAGQSSAQVTVALSPVPHMQFLSSTGAPLAAGCVYTYSGGTSTFLATYTDSTGVTQNTDPIQLDSGGFANIWLTAVAYKFSVYSNPSGGACPGTPGGLMVLQWTVDGIKTSTSSGGSTASQLTSSGANPATSGIVAMAKTDTICWRNVGNSANICASLDSANNLTWQGGSLALSEIAAPSGVAGEDLIWADSTAHRLKQSGNGGSAAQLVNAGADINTSDQVTATHLAAALPVAQGGTGQTALTGLPIPNAALITPTIGGTTITNVPTMAWGAYLCQGTSGGGCANQAPGINVAQSTFIAQTGGVTIKDFYFDSQDTPGGCVTNGVIAVYDETAASSLNSITFSNGTGHYGNTGLTINVASGHTLDIRWTTLPTSCTTTPVGNANVIYQMQ